MSRLLIKNANILSMDPAAGDFDDADILIENERIVAVGPNLEAGDAEVVDGRGRIVMPGFVNAHIHTWEYQLRGIGADWVSSRDYHANMHKRLALHYETRDVYLGNLLGSHFALKKGARFIRPMMLVVLVLLLGKLISDAVL